MARGKRNDKVSLFASSALLFLLLFRLGATTTTKEEKEERAEQGPNTLSAENWRRGGESSLLLPPAPTNNQIKFAKLPVVVSNKCTSVFPSSLSLSAGSRVGVLFPNSSLPLWCEALGSFVKALFICRKVHRGKKREGKEKENKARRNGKKRGRGGGRAAHTRRSKRGMFTAILPQQGERHVESKFPLLPRRPLPLPSLFR